MGLKEILKEQGLTDDQITKVTEEMGKAKIYTTSLENADERYSKLKSKKEDLDEQVKTANNTIKDLKKNNADNEELQATIRQHEDTIKTLKIDSDTKIKNLSLDNAINAALSTAKAKYPDLISGKFDRSKLVVNEDGTVTGVEEQFKTIQETYKDMFESVDSSEGDKGGNPTYKYNPTDGGNKGSSGSVNFIDVIHENQARK